MKFYLVNLAKNCDKPRIYFKQDLSRLSFRTLVDIIEFLYAAI